MKNTIITLLLVCSLSAYGQKISVIAGESISAGSLVYLSSGIAYNAVNTDIAKPAQAFCPAALAADETGDVYFTGRVGFDTGTNPPGTLFYLDASTDGLVTDTRPNGAYQVVFVSVYDSLVELLFRPRVVDISHTLAVSSPSSPQTLTANVDNLINQGSTQSSFTLKLPASAYDGDEVSITFNNAVTTLTIDGNGNTLSGTAASTAAVGTRLRYKYFGTASKWIRIQ